MKKEAEAWVKIAEEELQSAEYLFKTSLFRMVCYHAQQAVEKLMKALLSQHDVEFSRTHNLLDLKTSLESINYKVPLTIEEAVFLNSVYRSRYPASAGLCPKAIPQRKTREKPFKWQGP